MAQKQMTRFVSDNEENIEEKYDTEILIDDVKEPINNVTEITPILTNENKTNESQIVGVIAICSILFSGVALYASAYAKIVWSIVLSSIVLILSILTILNWFGIPITSTLKSTFKTIYVATISKCANCCKR